MASPNPPAARDPDPRRWEAAAPWFWVAAAVSAAWLMVSLAFAAEPAANRGESLDALGWRSAMAAAAGLGGGVAVYGLCLNDLLDRRRDRALRKAAAAGLIASGRLPRRAGLGVCLAALLLAVFCADAMGPASLKLTLLLAGGVLFYNLTLRFVPGMGVVGLGLLIALLMMVPNPRAGFLWPVLLSMTQVMAIGRWRNRGAYTPAWSNWLVVLGWAFWVLWVVVLIRERAGLAAGVVSWWLPAAAGGVGLVVAIWWGRSQRGRAAVGRFAVGWLLVIDATWLASWGRWDAAGLHLGLLVATGFTAWAWSRRVPTGRVLSTNLRGVN
ncbi:MAG: hypothetical protein AAF800_07980 [Planctomycetota bacterium]